MTEETRRQEIEAEEAEELDAAEAELDEEVEDVEFEEEDVPAADDDYEADVYNEADTVEEEFEDDSDDFVDEDFDYEEETDISYVDGPSNFTGGSRGGGRGRGRGRGGRNLRAMAREVKIDDVNYKRIQILSRFVDRHGRIFSRRKTRISAKMQRKIAQEIKRARHLALMPYTREHVRITRKRSS